MKRTNCDAFPLNLRISIAFTTCYRLLLDVRAEGSVYAVNSLKQDVSG